MPISVCQESVQDVFSHTVQVVTRQRHISVFQGLFCQAFGSSFKPSSESRRGFLCWPKRQLPLKLLIFPHLPLHVVSIPCATAACYSVKHRACSVGWRLRHPCVRRQTAWQHPTAKLVVILTTQK